MLIPESNHLGFLEPHLEQHQQVDYSAVGPLLNAGDAVAFGPFTIHGSNPNRSPRPRRIFINSFSYPGADR